MLGLQTTFARFISRSGAFLSLFSYWRRNCLVGVYVELVCTLSENPCGFLPTYLPLISSAPLSKIIESRGREAPILLVGLLCATTTTTAWYIYVYRSEDESSIEARRLILVHGSL